MSNLDFGFLFLVALLLFVAGRESEWLTVQWMAWTDRMPSWRGFGRIAVGALLLVALLLGVALAAENRLLNAYRDGRRHGEALGYREGAETAAGLVLQGGPCLAAEILSDSYLEPGPDR